MTARFLRTFAVRAYVTVLFASMSWGQSSSGDISGRVIDPTGQAIAGATLTLTRVDTGEVRTFTSEALGEFIFTSIQPGAYELTAKAQGFKLLERKGLALSASEHLSVGD